ncbi:MAG: hypothetical protein EZS28_045920 [Streblomastix strix]|uniref:Tyr recombinase domain-containing protein n=1 Tax=Streblomastix strix TaxID=222440 RepID=A0A5J4TLC7_9EUKA|nr:MAG: hypothetical protein EZS28_045920 [Streblomastix strix]
MIYKGNQGRVEISLHQIKGEELCPVFWYRVWSKYSFKFIGSTQCTWGFATREDCSLRIRQLLFEAGIPKPLRVTDIRAAALTKLISSGATKEEADRWSRLSQQAETVRRYYDKNNNQSAREIIAGSFNEVSLLGGKLPRRGGSVQSRQWL